MTRRSTVAVLGLVAWLVAGVFAMTAAAQVCEGRACPTSTTVTVPGATTTTTVPPPEVKSVVEPGEGLVPNIQLGAYPSSNYDLGYDEGAWNALSRKSLGTIMTLAFQAARTITSVGIFAVHTVLTAPFELVLAPVVSGVGQALAVFTGELRLLYYGLWASIFAGLLLFLRGRGVTAIGEILFSVAALLISATLVTNLGGYYTGAAKTIRNVSMLAVTATAPNPANDPHDTVLNFDRSLQRSFVEQPWLALNWGGPSKVAACPDRVDQALAEGPNDTDDRPRVLVATGGTKVDPDKVDTSSDTAQQVKGALGIIKKVGAASVGLPPGLFSDKDGNKIDLADVKGPCAGAASFNAKPTGDRSAGAVFLGLASLFVFALLLRVASRQVTRGLIVAFGFMTAPVAFAFLAFPGDARDSAFKHFAWIARSAVHMIGSFLILGLVIATMNGITSYQVDPAIPGSDQIGSMMFRFALLAGVGLAANLFMGKALRAAGAASVRGTARLAGAVKSSGRAPAFLTGAMVGATGALGAMAAKHQQVATQVRSAKTLGSAVSTGAHHMSAGAMKVAGAPLAIAKAPVVAAAMAGRAAKGMAARVSAHGQPMAPLAAGLSAGGWQVSPAAAKRAPVAAATLTTAAVRVHAGLHGRPAKPTAPTVARGNDGPPPHYPGAGGRYLYNETKPERHKLPTYQAAVGGTLFPDRESTEAWQRRTEHRVARVTGAVGRPLVATDFDPAMNHDRVKYAIARSEVIHQARITDTQPKATPRRRSRKAG